MKNLTVVAFLCCIFASALQSYAQGCGDRYRIKLFEVDKTENLPYGENVRFNGDTQTLTMNLFQPMGDTLAARPVIILAFGGSFTSGWKGSPDIDSLCRDFAEMGYVTASIDYRIGTTSTSDSIAMLQVMMRAMQDAKAAIRFFKKDYSTTNLYRADTNQIFMGGTSAGGFIGLNVGYLKDNPNVPPPPPHVVAAVDSVGGLEGFSGSQGYSSSIKGVINLCGAMADTSFILPGDPILVSVHGTSDDLVPYEYGPPASSTANFFGSKLVHQRAENVGVTNDLHTFLGAEHVPFTLLGGFDWADYYDTTFWHLRDFLYDNLDCNRITGIAENELAEGFEMKLFPNPATDQTFVVLKKSTPREVQLEVVDMLGRQVYAKADISALHPIPLYKHQIGKGMFQVIIRDRDSGELLQRKAVLFE